MITSTSIFWEWAGDGGHNGPLLEMNKEKGDSGHAVPLFKRKADVMVTPSAGEKEEREGHGHLHFYLLGVGRGRWSHWSTSRDEQSKG